MLCSLFLGLAQAIYPKRGLPIRTNDIPHLSYSFEYNKGYLPEYVFAYSYKWYMGHTGTAIIMYSCAFLLFLS